MANTASVSARENLLRNGDRGSRKLKERGLIFIKSEVAAETTQGNEEINEAGGKKV